MTASSDHTSGTNLGSRIQHVEIVQGELVARSGCAEYKARRKLLQQMRFVGNNIHGPAA